MSASEIFYKMVSASSSASASNSGKIAQTMGFTRFQTVIKPIKVTLEVHFDAPKVSK